MTKVKDGFWKQLGSKVGSNDYLLKAAGGYIGVGNSSGEVVPLNNGTKNEGLNADMVDGLHTTNLVKFYLSPMEGGAPASSAKSWFENTMPSGAGAIVYNVPGSEKTIIVGKSTGPCGHMLQLNYDDKYLRILRYYAGNWRSDDWEKISAGYADSAGDADKLDGYHANDFATAGHTHYIGNKPASDLSSTYPQGISVGGIYGNGYPFNYGSTITAYGSGGYFQIAGQWNSDITGASNYDFPTEMYIRGRRDSYDVWTTWTRVLTDRNYTNVLDNRYYTETEVNNLLAKYLPLAGGWLDTGAQIYFKGLNQSTSVWGSIGYRAYSGNGNNVMHTVTSPNNTGALYITTNGYDSANDYGGLAIDNDGVTAFGAGDSGSVFRVLNEDNIPDGAQFMVHKNAGAAVKYRFSIGQNTVNTSYNLYVNGTSYLNGWCLFSNTTIIIPVVSYTKLIESYGLRSDYTSAGYPTDEFLKAWCKYAYEQGAGYVVHSYISPSSRGYIVADIYASGLVTQAQVDGGGIYETATVGLPVHITGRYYPHGGSEIIFGTSYGTWYYRRGLDSGNYTGYLGYIGTTAVQASSTAQALTGITAFTFNGASSAGTNYITGTAGRIYFGGNFHIDSLGSNATYINHYTANNVYLVSGSSQGNVGIGTTSPGYKLQISGDSYTTGWSRAANGFYVEGTGVHFTHQESGVGEIDMTSNNEFLWGSSTATLYFNYRTVSRGTTVNNYIWNAGSSSSYASHTLGSLTSIGNQTLHGLTSTCNSGNSASYTQAAVQIREYNFGGAQSDTWGNAPRLAWHWSGRVQAQIGLASDNHLYISEDGSFSTPRLILHSGNTYVSNGKGIINGSTITQVDNADTIDDYHVGDLDFRYTRTGWSFCSPSDNSMTGSTNLQDWVTNMYNQGGYKGYSSITVGSWWWVRSLDFSSPVGTIRTSGAMIIYSGDGNSNKNCKHFLVLDAAAELYGITSNEESWKYYSRFLNNRNYTDYVYSKTDADDRFVNVTGDTMSGALTCNDTIKSTHYGPGFANDVDAGKWAYTRFKSGSNEWHIGTNSSAAYIGAGGAFEIRSIGASYSGISVRYNTSSYGKLVVSVPSGECSIGYYSNGAVRWTVGCSDGSNYGWYQGSNGGWKMTLNTSGYLTASGFIKSGSSDSYVLLGGGGHKALSDFSMAHSHPYLSFSSIYPTNTINLNDYFSSSTMYKVYYDYSGSSKIQNGPYESDAGAVINFPTYSGTQVYFNYNGNDVKVRTHYNGHITNWATFITSENIRSQSVNYADSAGSVAWGNVTGKPFNWSGQSGQPTWLWGSNDGTNYYVWNPSNFSVNYANSAGNAGSANGLASTGYGNGNLTYYQTSNSFFDNSGWCHYIIANHGDGSSYYNFTIGLPFWGVPIYKRLEDGTGDGWHTFITSENIGSQSVNYADSAGYADNANKLDNIDSTGFLAWTGMSASGGSSAPFQTSVDFFNNTANLNAGARMIYNYPGSEYTILYTRRSDDVGHGTILRWGYPDNYIRMIRMISGSPQTSDWEKISAGYADSAGDADKLDGYHANDFATAGHTHDGRYLRYEGWFSSGSGQNVDNANGMTFVYGDHGSPNGWGILCTFDYTYNSDYKFQLFAEGYSASGMYYRCRSSDRGGWTSWKTVIDDGNIGSQSVNYANYSEYSTRLDGGAIAGWGTLTSSNGFSGIAAYDWEDKGAFCWAGKSDKMYMQVDGWFYQNEGQYRVLDTSDAGSLSVNYANYAGYLTAYTSSTGGTGANKLYLWNDWNNTGSLGTYFHGIWVGSPDGNIGYDLAYLHGDKTHLYMRSYDYGTWNSWYKICTNADTYVASDGTNRGIIDGSEVASVRHLLINGVTWNSDWNWSGQSGQPSWLWGSNDGVNMYVWNPSNFSVNYANSAGSASSSTYARYLNCPDTRSSASAPGDYTATSTGVSFDFKESSVTGLSGYSGVMTVRPYGSAQDWSGGEAHQIAFLAGGGLYHRIGTSSWGSWERILTSSNWSSYISIPSVGNGTVTITQAGSTIGSFTMNQSGNTLIALNDTNTNYYPIRSYTSGLQISSYSGSTDCALFVPYATANQAGVVSTETQTFSGQKTFSSIRLRSTDTVNFGGYLYFGDGSYAYLAELADDQLTLNASKIFLGISGNQKYYIDGTIFRPVTANSTSSSGIALGSSDYRFTCGYFSDKVYAYKGFYESSDERLKRILNSVKVNLDDLSKLRKVYYLWKDRTEDGIQLGMIAQDVQRLYPELVSVDKETGYLSLAYDKLSVLALEAIDVLYKEHKKLKKHVDELEKLLINNKIY